MKRFLRIAAITGIVVLCVAGVYVSSLLLQEHLDKTTGHTWFDAVCGESDEEGVTNCEKVIQSEWGVILGMPSAYWGMAYFLGLGLWFVFIGRPSFPKRYWHLAPTLAAMAGAAGSVFFIVIMYTRLEQRCVWCVVTHGINFAVLILTLPLWPRRPAASPREAEAPAPGSPASRPSPPRKAGRHPSTRLALAVVAMVVFSGAYLWQGVLAEAARAKAAQTLHAVSQTMYRLYQSAPRHRIRRRPDDPQRTADDERPHVQTVVFSDFECGHCGRFAKALQEQFNPLFDNHLRIIFKHYPLCTDCNPHVKKTRHPYACKAAQAAEAALLQGGNEAFWKAHDILFKAAGFKLLGKMNYRKLADNLNLDPEQFVADMESERVARRITEDIELARSLGVRGTPAVFVSGREVPRVARMEVEFWQQVARLYKSRIAPKDTGQHKHKPAHRSAEPAGRPAATPDTPGR